MAGKSASDKSEKYKDEPQLCLAVENPEIYESNPAYCAQRKYDGKAVKAGKEWQEADHILLNASVSIPFMQIARGKVKTLLNGYNKDIIEELQKLPFKSVHFHAEQCYFNASDVTEKGLNPDAKEVPITAVYLTEEEMKKKNLVSVLVIHDITELDGKNFEADKTSFSLRYLELGRIRDDILSLGGFTHLFVAPTAWSTQEKINLWKKAEELKWEGVVYKQIDAPYTVGKSLVAIKRKRSATFDCVVVGVTKGLGKYDGMIGALVCAQYKDGKLEFVAKTSGMDDQTRADLLTQLLPLKLTEEELVGKKKDRSPYCEAKGVTSPEMWFWVKPELVVELEAMRRNESLHLVQPRFKRIRSPEKYPEDCVIDFHEE